MHINLHDFFHLLLIDIKKKLRIIGAAAAASNLLCEFIIAEKNDAKHIKNKNGKVNLVKSTAKFIFSWLPLNPGAIRKTKYGMKISIIKTRKNKPKISKLKTFVVNFSFKNKKPNKAVINGIEARQSKVTAAVVFVMEHINVIMATPRPLPPITPDKPILK